MQKIAIFTDSACDLTDAELKEYGIRFLPLQIIYKDSSYRDRVEISADEVYGNLEVEVPKTSLPTGTDIDALFTELKKEGYTHAIGVMISGGLSGTANSVKLVAEEHPEIETYIYDTKNLSISEGIMALKAAKMVRDGLSFEAIKEALPEEKKSVDTYYCLATLEYLIKGGRIGKVSGTIGQMLNIKPIIYVNEEGIYVTLDKARGTKQAYMKLVSILKENLEKTKCKVYVMHGGAKKEAQDMVERIKDLPGILSLEFRQISPALGVHTGRGLIGIAVERMFT
ncbi:DegV family protein [Proteiniclasticum ruminis]|uniref:EDD domain protein, DegV family n=1 Tax=Proteiniclasticum ruminis TaxID=398199 RepID=A0A1G8M343_9CLOT|nr:DegV family protein [Proteiniclasticum ruminis]SDI62362.1 EDD domain protein, DegV family [Proteiniclasticum ruminis]